MLEPVGELASVVGFRRFTISNEAQLLDERDADLLYAAAVALPRPGMDA